MCRTLRSTVPSWPPTRPALTRGERLAFITLIVVTMIITLARLGAGGRELAPDDEQCSKWPPYQTARCFEMIPLDEVHYVPDARDVLRFGTESDTRVPTEDDGAFVVHPPVGKWFIAAGIAVLGDRPEGWRVGGALAGIAGVAMLFAIARRLFGSARWALVAGGMLAIDGLWLTMSRVAMLDIVAASFSLAVAWGAIEVVARTQEGRKRSLPLLGSAVAAGFALATKWSTGSFVVAAVLLVLFAEFHAWRQRRRAVAPAEVRAFGPDALAAWALLLVSTKVHSTRGTLRRLAASAVALVIIPLVVYTATFAPWFADSQRYIPPTCESESSIARAWLCYQGEQLAFHRGLEKYEPIPEGEATDAATGAAPSPGTTESSPTQSQGGARMRPAHPYFGHAISWAWLGRPVVHNYFESGEGAERRITEVMGVPNPLAWWAGFALALPWLIARARRDRTARLLLAFITAGWLPYLLADLVARPVFLFYATPLVPFIVLATTALARRLHEGDAEHAPIGFVRGLVSGTLVAIALIAIWMYPIHAGVPLPPGDLGWNGRIWFATDCASETIKVLCWI